MKKDRTEAADEPFNILTLDIEDWQQSAPDTFSHDVPGHRKPVRPSRRIIGNVQHLLEILNACEVHATCFILGSVAEDFPALVREIAAAGHEIGTHGYGHRPVYTLEREEFQKDVRRSVQLLEDAAGVPVIAHRAPYFSITSQNEWAFDALAEIGIQVDASTFPLKSRFYRVPGWIGCPDWPRYPHILETEHGPLLELPSTTVRLAGNNLPLAGGAYLRMVPLGFFHAAVRSANRHGAPAVFYLHPHDLDTDELHIPMPGETIRDAMLRRFLRLGRGRNPKRLTKLLRAHKFGPIAEWHKQSNM